MPLSTKIFTTHENIQLSEPADRVEFVREGFSFLAALFTPIWLIANRMWLETLGYLLLLAGIFEAADQLRFSAPLYILVQVFVQVMIGSFAFDIRRGALARHGFQSRGVVVAETSLNAQRRYFDHTA